MSKVLEQFSTMNGLAAWIDVLGVRNMEPARRDTLYDNLATFLPDFSTNFFDVEKNEENKINETNALIIGDALCITQSGHSAGSRLFVVHTALTLSKLLFAAGFSHRGFITQGAYRADHPDNGLPFITGDAIINAVTKEEGMKITGIGFDPAILHHIKGMRERLGTLYWTKSPIFGKDGYHLLSSNLHLRPWSEFCKQFTVHPYIATAKTFVDQTDLWDM